MPNTIKYSLNTEPLSLKKGDFYIGTGDVGKGPTSTTGYWQGITPPSGGYTIYVNKESEGPSIRVANNDSELINITNSIANTSYTSATQCLVYYASQTDKVCLNRDYEGIVTDGLVLNLDAGFIPSYPTTGTIWYDVSGYNNNGTLTNSPTYTPSDGGAIVFDGTDDYVNMDSNINSLKNLQSGTIEQWVKLDSSLTSCTSFFIGSDINNRFEVVFGNRGSVVNEAAGIIVFINSVQTFVFWVIRSSSNFYFDNQWHQFVYKSDNTGNGFYIDGVKQNVSYTNGNSTTQQFFYLTTESTICNIGRRVLSGVPSQLMKGQNSINRIYTRALTDVEILQNYNAQKTRFGL